MTKAFIAHSSENKTFVRTLKEDLNENGVETWYDEDCLDLGDSLIENLESALDKTTHFLIILSPDSVESDWVNFELNKALDLLSEGTIKKIIPIKYRECEVPPRLRKLLSGDLTNETVVRTNNKVKFVGEGYSLILARIIRAIKNSKDNCLTKFDKKELQQGLTLSENDLKEYGQKIKAIYKLIGYLNNEAKNKYRGELIDQTQNQIIKNLPKESIYPIFLPNLLHHVFPNLKVGDELHFTYKNNQKITGHFLKFRINDLKIVLPLETRTLLSIKNLKYYRLEIDPTSNMFIFYDL